MRSLRHYKLLKHSNNQTAIYFVDIPRIKKGPPASLTTKEGSNVSLPCYSKGYPNPEITWYRNGQKLDSANYDAVTGELKFPSIQFGDRGLYKCEARNFLGFDSATVKIVVEGLEKYFCIILKKRLKQIENVETNCISLIINSWFSY